MKEKRKFHVIDPYGTWMEVVVTKDIRRSTKSKSRQARLGKIEPAESGVAAVTWNSSSRNRVAMIFDKGYVSHTSIAHEAFHSTVGIMKTIGNDFDSHNHESFAYLNGHISKLIYEDMKKWGIRVK